MNTETEKHPDLKEGQLMIDIYQTNSEIVIQVPVAGAKAKDLNIFIEDNTVTIKGIRNEPGEENGTKEFLHQECYWGVFSRKVILPEGVDIFRAQASLKEGILILRMPKMRPSKKRKIIIKEE